METKFTTNAQREQWLARATRILRPYFAARGYTIPARLAVSVGFPEHKRAIGQCWYPQGSASGQTTHIFIGPDHPNGVEALDTLAHELVHAALGAGFGHGSKFRTACARLGLTKGKPTEAAAGPELRVLLERIARHLGDFPHDPLRVIRKGRSGQSNSENWIKLMSPVEPAYRMEVRPQALRKWGIPLDPWGHQMVEAVGRAPAIIDDAEHQ